jgi:hypothetical protein
MARRRIGQESFGFVEGERGRNGRLDATVIARAANTYGEAEWCVYAGPHRRP